MDFSTGRMKHKQPMPPQLNGKQSAAASPAACSSSPGTYKKCKFLIISAMLPGKITPTVGRAVNTLMGKNICVSILNNWLGRNHSEFQYPYTYTLAIR